MSSDADITVDPVPPGTRLVHVGFHKSGTTALQESLRNSAAGLARAGIVYPRAGKERHHGRPALGLLGVQYGWERGGIRYDKKHWTELIAEVEQSSDQTVVISSEHLGPAPPEVIRQVADDLGRGRTHVVATLRPLDKVLPSSWQQYVKGGVQLSYPSWLEGILADPPDPKITPNFWKRHGYGDSLGRWTKVLGPDRVTVIVLDDSDRSQLFSVFEQLLGLPDGVLAGARRRDENRSLTALETELVRQAARAVQESGRGWVFYDRTIRRGVAQRLARERVPPPDEPRIVSPAWALERAAEIGARQAEQISRLGVRVIGDLSALGRTTSPAGPDVPLTPDAVPIDVAVDALVGALLNYRKHAVAIEANEADQSRPSPLVSLRRLGGRRLLRSVQSRIRAKI